MANELDFLRRYTPMSLEEELAQSKPASYKSTGEAFRSMPEVTDTKTPNLITDPEAIKAARLAEIEAAYRASPNRAIESAHAIDHLLSPNFEMVGEPTTTQQPPNFKLQGRPYTPNASVPAVRSVTPEVIPDSIEAPVPVAKADIPVRGYATENPMMGRYMDTAAGTAGVGLALLDRYLHKKENEPFFNPKASVEDRERSYNDLMQQKDLLNTYNPTGGGKMPSEQDLSPLASKVNLSDYMEQQPKLLRTNLSDETGISDDPYDTYSNYKKMLNIIPNLPKSEYAKSLDKKELDKLNKQILDKDQALKNAPGINSKMLEPFSTNEAVDSKMVEPFSTSRLDLSRYFGNTEGASNLVDMNAKLPPSKSTPSWSADAVKQSQEMKSTEGTQPKLSAAQNKAIQSNPTKAKEEAEAKVKEAEKTLSAQDISTKEYDDAIKQRNMNQFIATMAQAAERIGYSLAGGNAQVLKPDLSFTNKMMEQAGQPVVDLKERRKEKEEQEGNDPNSAKSKQFQDILISMHPELESKIRKMSYTNLEKQFPSIMNALNARESIRARKETAAFNREALQIAKDKATLETQNSAITNDLVKLDKKHMDELGELNNAIKVAELGELNPVAATNVVRAIVKGVEGGNGKVSDKDITTAMGYRGVSGELQAWIRGKTTGTMPKTLTKDIINLMYAMKDVKQKSYENSMNNILEIRARGQRRDVNEVKEQFIPGYSANKTQELDKKPEATSNKNSWEYKGK
jgi:hypothetical protein